MADTLTQLIAKIQPQLLDNGTLFTTATVTTAVRQALAELNARAPLHAADLITAIANQQVYELSDTSPSASGITDILLQGTNEHDTPLAYVAYVEDARWFFRLHTPLAAGQTIIAQYTKPHTVSGLDAAADSTLPDDLNNALILGACYFCALTRAAATIEANNVEEAVPTNWLKTADAWRTAFDLALARPSHEPPASTAAPAAWNDSYHRSDYP